MKIYNIVLYQINFKRSRKETWLPITYRKSWKLNQYFPRKSILSLYLIWEICKSVYDSCKEFHILAPWYLILKIPKFVLAFGSIYVNLEASATVAAQAR
jgi:hypothetical protein